MPDDKDLANARLIAAAPELLKACKEALEALDWVLEKEVREQLKEAIAKAEGK